MKFNRNEIFEMLKDEYRKENFLPDENSTAYGVWEDNLNSFVFKKAQNDYNSENELMNEIKEHIQRDKEDEIDNWLSVFSV